jgi:adenosylcobinamide-phosphate synthase
MVFLPLHLCCAYALDLVAGDPSWLPHPVRWIGRLITWMESLFYEKSPSRMLQRLAGCAFWASVVLGVLSGSLAAMGAASHIHPVLGHLVMIWIAFCALATRSLHKESKAVATALEGGEIELARQRLSWIVSRDTTQLDEKDIVRALIETVSENISDGIVAPLFYLALGGPAGAMVYKAINTMDSMVGYTNERYHHFGWFAARADDVANWIPARLTALLVIGAAAFLTLDWRSAWRILRRDARKMKSPNAGYPEAAAAGALGVQLGGTNVYFGATVQKPTLGDPGRALTLAVYRSVVRLMYTTSFMAFALSLVTLFFMHSP